MRSRQVGVHEWDFGEEHYTWFDNIALKLFDWLRVVFGPINSWSNNRKRNVKIRVDEYDAWSAEHTLALIIHPVLVKLQKMKNGSPYVDPEDVPEHLCPTEEPNEDNGYIDNTHHERWNWIIDEMIWAFGQHTMGADAWEDQYIYNSDQLDIKFVKIEDGKHKGYSSLECDYQKDPSKPPYFRDEEAIKAHHDRMANGRRLFAKYYNGLWD